MFKSSNPALKTNTFANFREQLGSQVAAESQLMTLEGTINKTGLLLIMTVAAAIYPWTAYFNGDVATTMALASGGGIVALALSFFTIFMAPKSVRWVAPIFAVAEGLALGGISAQFETAYPGIALMSLVSTFSVLGVMLAIYRFKIIKVTERFKAGVMAAVGAIMILALVSFFTSMVFGFSLLHHGGMLGIGISGAIIVVFSLYLLVTFKNIEEGVAARAPKWAEWYGAFGILVAMIWLYMEIMRLASLLRD